MLHARDTNTASGRTSRASNLSAMSREPGKHAPVVGPTDLLPSAAPSIQAMLRTSTEMGNLGGSTGELSGISGIPRATARHGNSSRHSTASSLSNNSGRSRQHRQHPSSSLGAQRSSMRDPTRAPYAADTLSPTMMYVPLSSPLIPLGRETDSHRSRSMTTTMHQPHKLLSNRSLGSLHHGQGHRPKSPLPYPRRVGKANYRSPSPALSDTARQHPRYQHTQSSYGHPHNVGQSRVRLPSDTSIGYQDRMQRPHRHPNRATSPVYFARPGGNIPPVPPLNPQRIMADRNHMLNRSVKSSVSSGSTNLRADSDAPPSDRASPPTPNDGTSMEVHVSPNSTRGPNGTNGTMSSPMSRVPDYYDYSEPFERDLNPKPDTGPIARGAVNQIKTVVEEQGSAESIPKSDRSSENNEAVPMTRLEDPGISELPASPVPQRITRGLVLKHIDGVSSTGDMDTSFQSPGVRADLQTSCSDDLPAADLSVEQIGESSRPEHCSNNNNRHSVLSRVGSSVLESSTIDFAVRYSIPMATGNGFGTNLASEPESEPVSSHSPGHSTEDGMSELLAGYQHTESKHEENIAPESEAMSQEKIPLDKPSEKRSHRAQQPSDEQSFKSCTDLPESMSKPVSPELGKDSVAKSSDLASSSSPQRETSVKDSDARSFKTAKDASSPGRVASISSSQVVAFNLANIAAISSSQVKPSNPAKSMSHQQEPVSEMQPPKPPPSIVRKQLPDQVRESSFSAFGNMWRAGSKPSIEQGSVSLSGSSSTLGVTPQPPVIPPRGSSSSREAQQHHGVTSFLIRQFAPRFSKGKMQPKEEDVSSMDEKAHPNFEAMEATQASSAITSLPHMSSPIIKTPEKVLQRQSVIPEKPMAGVDLRRDCTPRKVVGCDVTPTSHHQPYSSPGPMIHEPSSVYSPQDNSFRHRSSSSPAGVPRSQEYSHRDSQTTTHLSWPPRRSSIHHSISASESHLPLTDRQEDTTTDARQPRYRHSGQPRYLADVKEESHEDSSLNTSASNLRNSSARFPIGMPSVARPSVDDAFLFSGASSTGSHRRSGLGGASRQPQGLPPIEFSQADLFEGLNEKFGLRHSKSLGEVHVVGESSITCDGSPPRPASAGQVGERCPSGFVNVEGVGKIQEYVQRTTAMSAAASRRTYSPEEARAEVDQLSIPSVGGLTMRFSEYLPSLTDNFECGEKAGFAEEEAIMEHAIEEIHELGPAQKRSSARLRPIPGSPNMVVIEDAVYDEITSKDKSDSSPVSQGDGVTKVGSGGVDSSAKDKGTSATDTTHTPPLFELQAPSPTILRPRSQTLRHQAQRASVDSELSPRRSLRSFVSTPTATDTRPWNCDKNYPWATTTIPSVNISLPHPTAAITQSPRLGQSHLRNSHTPSVDSFSSSHTATASPFGSADRNTHAHLHRFSAFGQVDLQPHGAGERYPTSALTPPTVIFGDHFEEADTSDDDEYITARKNKLSLRKRFSTAHRATTEHGTRIDRVKTKAEILASPASTQQAKSPILQDSEDEAAAQTQNNRHTFRDAQGMRPGAYRQQRLLDHLKRWLHKGANLFRLLSTRKRTHSTIN